MHVKLSYRVVSVIVVHVGKTLPIVAMIFSRQHVLEAVRSLMTYLVIYSRLKYVSYSVAKTYLIRQISNVVIRLQSDTRRSRSGRKPSLRYKHRPTGPSCRFYRRLNMYSSSAARCTREAV